MVRDFSSGTVELLLGYDALAIDLMIEASAARWASVIGPIAKVSCPKRSSTVPKERFRTIVPKQCNNNNNRNNNIDNIYNDDNPTPSSDFF